jgi:hypothetical protein
VPNLQTQNGIKLNHPQASQTGLFHDVGHQNREDLHIESCQFKPLLRLVCIVLSSCIF